MVSHLVKIAKNIFTVPSFLCGEECQAWISLGEELGFEKAGIRTEFGERQIDEVRNNDRVILDDVDRANDLWDSFELELPPVLPEWKPVGLNERLRFYRYDVGQKFRWHGDGIVRRDSGEKSLLTFLVYLNEDFSGGGTCFRDGITIQPQQGMLLLFAHWLKHMGEEVSAGRKYVLRSDVMFTNAKP